MMPGLILFRNLAAVLVLALPEAARAWDALGHGLAANVGAKLMKDPAWSAILQSQAPLLGAAAAFPDVPFRAQSTAIAGFEAEAPNHYFHIDEPSLLPELGKLRRMTCPKALDVLAARFGNAPPEGGRLPASSDPSLNRARLSTVGVSPWRAEQFRELARRALQSPTVAGRLGQEREFTYYLGLGAHLLADHAVPWHAMQDAQGAASGQSNLHVFLEHCTDAFLDRSAAPASPQANEVPALSGAGEKNSLYDPEFASRIERRARRLRAELLKALPQGRLTAPELAIRALEESLPHHVEFEAIDSAGRVAVSGANPAPGTPTDDPRAERPRSACTLFKDRLEERLATAAAFVSVYFDGAVPSGLKPTRIPPPTEAEVAEFAKRDYPWFECSMPSYPPPKVPASERQ